MDEIKKILEIVSEEKSRNDDRFDRMMETIARSQALCADRYAELRSSIDHLEKNMVTKDEFQRAFDSLSEDIGLVITDESKLGKRVNVLERRVLRLEQEH